MSGEVVKTAGLQSALAAHTISTASPRRTRISLIRAALRREESTDDEVDEALEALLELAKDD
jgi:hypothetical protein